MSISRRQPKPRRARLQVVAVEVACPHCDEVQSSPSGSLFWTCSDSWSDRFCSAGCGTMITVRFPWDPTC